MAILCQGCGWSHFREKRLIMSRAHITRYACLSFVAGIAGASTTLDSPASEFSGIFLIAGCLGAALWFIPRWGTYFVIVGAGCFGWWYISISHAHYIGSLTHSGE